MVVEIIGGGGGGGACTMYACPHTDSRGTHTRRSQTASSTEHTKDSKYVQIR